MITRTSRSALPTDLETDGDQPGGIALRLLTSFLVLGVGAFVVVFLITRSMNAFAGRPWASVMVAGVLSGGLFALSAHSIVGFHRDQQRLRRRLNEPDSVEMLEVQPSMVLEVEAPGDTGPALCFALNTGEMLLLRGQWLLGASLYRARAPRDDGNPNHFNGLDEPHAFPASHFILHRWRDAEPFWIEIRGHYVPPTESRVRLPSQRAVGSCQIFAGKIESLQQDIDRALA